MTATQRRLVRDSFELLRQDARPFALLFYGKLFELDPSARRLFHNDIALQGRKLVDISSPFCTLLERAKCADDLCLPLPRNGVARKRRGHFLFRDCISLRSLI